MPSWASCRAREGGYSAVKVLRYTHLLFHACNALMLALTRGRTAYRLHLLQVLANSWGTQTWPCCHFCNTGYRREPCQPCHPAYNGRPKKPETAVPPDLEICEGNWKMAEDEPETVQSLLRNEIANNWIVETGLSIAEAREKWPLAISVGKLNVFLQKERAPPCPGQHRVPSEHKMPSARAPQTANGTQTETLGAFVGASIDFKAAHKQVQVRPAEMAFCCSPFRGNSTIL